MRSLIDCQYLHYSLIEWKQWKELCISQVLYLSFHNIVIIQSPINKHCTNYGIYKYLLIASLQIKNLHKNKMHNVRHGTEIALFNTAWLPEGSTNFPGHVISCSNLPTWASSKSKFDVKKRYFPAKRRKNIQNSYFTNHITLLFKKRLWVPRLLGSEKETLFITVNV